jgi:hypothetical protein
LTISGDNLAADSYDLYWDSGSVLITTTSANEIGHFEGITYTVPITATIGNIYTVTAQVGDDVVAAAPFEVIEPPQNHK